MKLSIVTNGNKKTGDMSMPSQFAEEFRPDLIKRAVHSLWSKSRQQYGADQEAGLRHSSKLSERRRKYRGCYGFGISRINRKILSRRGTRFNWVGSFSPQAVGGHRSHPPKAAKILERKINQKENQKAIRSAMAATMQKELVTQRGHKVPVQYPFVIAGSAEGLAKTKEVEQLLVDLGFADELARSAQKKVRAGMGTMRGRKYRNKKGVLIVASEKCALLHAAQNIPGVDVVEVKALNAELLAPGADAGRATLFTEKAVQKLAAENLFM